MNFENVANVRICHHFDCKPTSPQGDQSDEESEKEEEGKQKLDLLEETAKALNEIGEEEGYMSDMEDDRKCEPHRAKFRRHSLLSLNSGKGGRGEINPRASFYSGVECCNWHNSSHQKFGRDTKRDRRESEEPCSVSQ